ncbi:hypothetical protein [Desulfobacter vibrioformis]|uniref:hypothetical protein n=1 Tax=Desulfobacter vibrioformis TaxID=34031 RepID=UPI0012EC1CF4|nr:hypothetical protein [Desulfobacter vibrioformis]
MKIVNAVWEKRNLGVDCNEITISPDDSLETIKDEISKYETEYTVVKIPTGNIEALFLFQKLGYCFIETLTVCYHTGEDFNLNKIQKRILEKITYHKMNNDDIDHLFKEIKQGMFQTDRISMDPYFSTVQANQRYIYWINDELDRGSQLYKISYNCKDIGFFALKKLTDTEYFAFLSGNYLEYLSSGLGFCAFYCEVTEAKRQGAKRVVGSYSSNNRGTTAILLSIGHILRMQYYVFVKHN